MRRPALTIALLVVGAAAAATAAERAPLGVVRPLDPPTNPTTPEKVALGERLFQEKRLSADGTVSCATCHVATLAFTDGRARSIGVSKTPVARNAPSLLNVALNTSLFWDGRAVSLEDQARHPVLDLNEMGRASAEEAAAAIAAIPEYPPLFEKAFGDREVTLQRIARAIAAFERTLLAGDSPFDRWWAGDASAMGEAARRGFDLFQDKAGCAQCHTVRQSYALFTDGDFHNTGAGLGAGKDDVGRMHVTKRETDRGAFRTPTLRNVELTAPYMHDGSLATLEEVVEFYDRGGEANPNLSPLLRKLDLTKEEQADLVAFLRALTSPQLPRLDACDELLAQGRAREAFDAFRAELGRQPGDTRALVGVARAAVALDDAAALATAEEALRERVAALSPGGAADGREPVPELLFWLGRVGQVLSRHDDATAPTRQEDALAALRRAREGGAAPLDALLLEARLLEEVRGAQEARDVLELGLAARPGEPALRELRAAIAYRTVWDEDRPGEAARATLDFVTRELDALAAAGRTLAEDAALYRAYAHHKLGRTDAARAAYADAALSEPIAERALRGLRNLLAADLPRFAQDLEALRARAPDSPALLLFTAYEALQTDRLDDTERDLLRRRAKEPQPTAATRYYLAQVAARRGRRGEATDHYAAALALDASFPGLVTEFETYVRGRELRGFADVDALVADYRKLLAAGPRTPEFQVLARNNLGFTLREVAASYCSRGPARIQTLVEGAPARAREVLDLTVAIYEEAVRLIPDDAASLPFRSRWDYAAVLNDTGLMRHYFAEAQDLARAEELYLRAFDLTRGAYQDAYFYNLQFLYGFELDGRDAKWLELARVAKDAILKEDPDSETGFSPDLMKRAAARRDFERLSATRPR